jgi:hypothetical protein
VASQVDGGVPTSTEGSLGADDKSSAGQGAAGITGNGSQAGAGRPGAPGSTGENENGAAAESRAGSSASLVTQVDGFQVIVLRANANQAENESGRTSPLIVNKGMPDMDLKLSGEAATVEFSVPRETFAHGRTDTTVTLAATLADGSPLPSWLSFDPAKGKFSGQPEDFRGELKIRLIARDNQGNQVEVEFSIRIGDSVEKISLRGKPSLSAQIALANHSGSHDRSLLTMRQPVKRPMPVQRMV